MEDELKLEITYTLEQNDILHFQKYTAASKSWWEKVKHYASFVIMIASWIFIVVGEYSHILHVASVIPKIALYVGAPALFVVVFVLARLVKKERVDRVRASLQEPITIRLAKTGLSTQTGIETVEIGWPKLYDLAQDKTHLYFYLAKEQAYIVPKRAFGSPDQSDAFYEAALVYRNQPLSGEASLVSSELAPSPRLQRQIQYTVSHADSVHAQEYFQRRNRRIGKASMVVCVVLGLIGEGVLINRTSDPFKAAFGYSDFLGVVVVILFVVPFAYLLLMLNDVVQNAKNGSKRSGLQTLTVGLRDVTFSAEGTRLSVTWTDVKNVKMDLRLIYFLIGDISYSVPRDSFASPEDADDFYEMAKACWESAKIGTPLTELPQSQSWPPTPMGKA